jgi:hypothetical protein
MPTLAVFQLYRGSKTEFVNASIYVSGNKI